MPLEARCSGSRSSVQLKEMETPAYPALKLPITLDLAHHRTRGTRPRRHRLDPAPGKPASRPWSSRGSVARLCRVPGLAGRPPLPLVLSARLMAAWHRPKLMVPPAKLIKTAQWPAEVRGSRALTRSCASLRVRWRLSMSSLTDLNLESLLELNYDGDMSVWSWWHDPSFKR